MTKTKAQKETKQTNPKFEQPDIEELYQAIKARLIAELRVEGYALHGVVSGRLKDWYHQPGK